MFGKINSHCKSYPKTNKNLLSNNRINGRIDSKIKLRYQYLSVKVECSSNVVKFYICVSFIFVELKNGKIQ